MEMKKTAHQPAGSGWSPDSPPIVKDRRSGLYHDPTGGSQEAPSWVRKGHTRKPNGVVRTIYVIFDWIADFGPMILWIFGLIKKIVVGTWGFLLQTVMAGVNIAILGGILYVSVGHSHDLLIQAGMGGITAWVFVAVWETVFIYCNIVIDSASRKGKTSNWAAWTCFLMGWVFVEISNIMGMADNWIGISIGSATPVLLLLMKKVFEYQFQSTKAKRSSWFSRWFANQPTRTAQVGEMEPAQVGETGTAQVGDTGTAQVGDTGTAQVGDTEIAQVGETETTQVGETETAQVGEMETAQVGETETAQVGETETAQVGDTGTAQVGDTGTAQVGDTEIAQVGETETTQVGETETAQVGEMETAQVGETETAQVGETETAQVGETETTQVGETETAQVGEMEPAQVGETETTQVGETETAQVGEMEPAQVGETETTQVGETETAQVGEIETTQVGETETAQVGETETTQVGETETAQVGEMETAQVGETETTQVGDNKVVYMEKLKRSRKAEEIGRAIQRALDFQKENKKLPSKRELMDLEKCTDHTARRALEIIEEVKGEQTG